MSKEDWKELFQYILLAAALLVLMCSFCFRQSDRAHTTGGVRPAWTYEQLMEIRDE